MLSRRNACGKMTRKSEGIEVRVPCLQDLIRNKRASGRIKDMADAEALEEIQDFEQSGTGET